jgi:hypothetical protein
VSFCHHFTSNQKQKSSVTAMFVNGSGRNEQSLQRTFHRCFLPSFGSFGQAVSEAKILKNRPIRNKKLFGQMNRNLVGSIYGRFSIKLLISSRSINKYGCHRQFLFLIGRFLKIFSCETTLLTYQVSVHLAKRFQRRRF